MDAPSAQLHLELRTTIQHALSSRRPLIHRLNEHGSWVLQIPRPESAVRHGSRVYWNVLVDARFGIDGKKGGLKTLVFGSGREKKHAVGSVAEVEELLRSNEILASGLRLGGGRKSNTTAENESGRIETLIDAVVLTAQDRFHVSTLLAIHADVPLLCPPSLTPTVTALSHFRTVVPISVLGADGDRDWRSTSLPPLPDWLGIGALPASKMEGHESENGAALAVAFNNRYHNHSSRLAGLAGTSGTASGKRKRPATIQPDEDEEAAEVVVFAPEGLAGQDVSQVVYGDPLTRILACVDERNGRTKATVREDIEVHKLLRAKYVLSVREEAREETWFASWFRKPKTFAFGAMAVEERAAKRLRRRMRPDSAQDGEIDIETEYEELIAGESRTLR